MSTDDAALATKYVLAKNVKSYMTRNTIVMHQDDLTRVAATRMNRENADMVVVCDDDKRLAGVVTDTDILDKVSDVHVYAEATMLKDLMTSPVIDVKESSTVGEALLIMKEYKIRKLPVTSHNDVIGLISQSSIVDAIKRARETPPRLLSPPVKAVLGNLGFVLQFAGVLLFVPAIVATLLEDTTIATGIFLTNTLLLVTGFFLNSYGEKASLNLRHASILVVASLSILSLYGSIPYLYVLDGNMTDVERFANAFFSSAAGFSTGGVSIFTEPEKYGHSFTFFRSYTQLVGGMSFIYLVITAFYPEAQLRSMRAFISGKALHMKELFLTITIIFILYIVIVAIILFFLGKRDILDNVSLSMSTLVTGGFLPSSTILDELLWQEHLVLMGAMLLGALPFTFHYGFVSKKFRVAKLGREVVTYLVILGVCTSIFVVISGITPIDATFYAFSASTTAGLQHDKLVGLGAAAYGMLVVMMFIGGCGFSTAGGVKIFRLLLIRDTIRFFRKSTRSLLSVQKKHEIKSMLIIVMLFPAIASIAGIHLMFASHVPYDEAFFEASGIITTGGLSAGVVDLDTDPSTKIILSFLMILGRLEIIALIYIFVPKLD